MPSLQILQFATDVAIEKAVSEIISRRDDLADLLERCCGPEGVLIQAKAQFDYTEFETPQSLCDELVSKSVFNSLDCVGLAEALKEIGEAKAGEIADHLIGFASAKSSDDKISHSAALVLTGKGEPRSLTRYPSKAVLKVAPTLRDLMEAEIEHIMEGRSRINLLRVIEATGSLMTIADAMVSHYRSSKRIRGLLDFDDLVSRTADLLSRSDARSWVLYKLDLGIDHILLDEAQDTSPRQWQVITSLVDEFFSGASSRPVNRTVFAVGDEKQSIYSFQGAAPESFAVQKRKYQAQARSSEKEFEDVSLGLSFRSTTDVLGAVDTVFSLPEECLWVDV